MEQTQKSIEMDIYFLNKKIRELHSHIEICKERQLPVEFIKEAEEGIKEYKAEIKKLQAQIGVKSTLKIKMTDLFIGSVVEYNETHSNIESKEKVQTMKKILKQWVKSNKELGTEVIQIKIQSNSKKAKEALESFLAKELV